LVLVTTRNLWFERASVGLCGGRRLSSTQVTYPGTTVLSSLCTHSKKNARVYVETVRKLNFQKALRKFETPWLKGKKHVCCAPPHSRNLLSCAFKL